jgi:hypothetical protein
VDNKDKGPRPVFGSLGTELRSNARPRFFSKPPGHLVDNGRGGRVHPGRGHLRSAQRPAPLPGARGARHPARGQRQPLQERPGLLEPLRRQQQPRSMQPRARHVSLLHRRPHLQEHQFVAPLRRRRHDRRQPLQVSRPYLLAPPGTLRTSSPRAPAIAPLPGPRTLALPLVLTLARSRETKDDERARNSYGDQYLAADSFPSARINAEKIGVAVLTYLPQRSHLHNFSWLIYA